MYILSGSYILYSTDMIKLFNEKVEDKKCKVTHAWAFQVLIVYINHTYIGQKRGFYVFVCNFDILLNLLNFDHSELTELTWSSTLRWLSHRRVRLYINRVNAKQVFMSTESKRNYLILIILTNYNNYLFVTVYKLTQWSWSLTPHWLSQLLSLNWHQLNVRKIN
jgi:hypothetical protein